MITTTLNRIREYSPCEDGWANLLAGLGKTSADDAVLPFATILEINGLDDALLYFCAEPQYDREWRLLMVAYARRVQHLNTDSKVKHAIDVAEQYANGEATDEELNAARTAAWDAAGSAAGSAASAAAWDAASAAARTAARDAASAANAANAAAWAASAAARVAARDALLNAPIAACAAWEAERKWQEQEFLRCVTETGASDGCY